MTQPTNDELADPARRSPRTMRTDAGQATTEYALVLIGAAVIALLVVAWAPTAVVPDASANSSRMCCRT